MPHGPCVSHYSNLPRAERRKMNYLCLTGSRPRSYRHEPRRCPWRSTTPSRFLFASSQGAARTDRKFLTDILLEYLGLYLRQIRQSDDLDDGRKSESCPLGG